MRNKILSIIFGISILSIWELISYLPMNNIAIFSSPSKICILLYQKIMSGELLYHSAITAYEAFTGLILGTVLGCCIGFLMIYFPRLSFIFKPYLVGLSSIPIFAIAPLMIIWFGTGFNMKIILAFLSTVFITAFQAYEGAQKIAYNDKIFFDVYGASRKQQFWLLAFPASIEWIIQSLKLNASFCILGAFIGEFIASEAGLGYIILKASGLYDTTYVFCAIICIIILCTLFNYIAYILNKYKIKIIRFVSVRWISK